MLISYGLQTVVSFSVLKADQTSILKFPVSPLSCSLGAPLGSALLSGAAGLQVGSSSHHLPLDLHLRGKLDPGGDAVSKTKKGRRSRTVFTELQLMGLEKRFEKQKYLSTPDRYTLFKCKLPHVMDKIKLRAWWKNIIKYKNIKVS